MLIKVVIESEDAILERVFEDEKECIFSGVSGEYSDKRSFLTEEIFEKMNDAIECSFKKSVDIHFIPYKWFCVKDSLFTQKQIIYYFFERLGRKIQDSDVFDAIYTTSVNEYTWDWIIEE